ncbi:type IV toxin-antitoxin system AbiEi family antitoxin domain-containing protein [Phytoactinopolyspora endophytica]|uniref:type IV toxin-antitoxin system AbiEi family antitoxin domain-containing protein n=1 Tax=Phytoactinopolyspora endophytica TaxID=1642495 RepID=UPI00101BDE1A|nr:type IV toxin-antitoxin system AbiEi family antitoxin domain-containing protein [Phytoactinopolyspora endophytica]
MAVDLTSFANDGRSLDTIVREQDGVVRLEDIAHVMTRAMVRHAVRSGRWSSPHRGVYVAHNGELTRKQELLVCLRAAPPGSALAGLTAAELDGLQGFKVTEVYVVIPTNARPPARTGLIVKKSRVLTTDDVHPVRQPRRTRLPRSLVDSASWTPHETRARAVILAGVQQRLTRPDDLRDALSRRANCRHRVLIAESIEDAEGGIASVPEREFDQICRMFDLPEPERQAVVRRLDGRYYLDAHWPRYEVGAEVHGIQHMEILNWDADLDRQAEISARGDRVLPFTSFWCDTTRLASGRYWLRPFETAAGTADGLGSAVYVRPRLAARTCIAVVITTAMSFGGWAPYMGAPPV